MRILMIYFKILQEIAIPDEPIHENILNKAVKTKEIKIIFLNETEADGIYNEIN